jgi:hypothetical protein
MGMSWAKLDSFAGCSFSFGCLSALACEGGSIPLAKADFVLGTVKHQGMNDMDGMISINFYYAI